MAFWKAEETMNEEGVWLHAEGTIEFQKKNKNVVVLFFFINYRKMTETIE